MAPDPTVAVSSGGGTSGASRRCLAPPEIGTRLSMELD
jgi:predicted MPP superfamily phosphohydrolase